MPPVKVTRSSNGAAGQLPDGAVSPEEAAAIRSGVTGKEVAPSSRIQSGVVNWRLAVDQLGNPYEVDRIAISQLRRMRRDPMLGFGLAFTKMPHVRSKWYVNAVSTQGPNAQIAAHLDYDLRRIWPSYVLLCLNALDFGFQAMAKRFELRTPAGTYIETNPDTGEQEEKPIWAEGGVDPIGWKPFVALRPEGVEPVWSNDGQFDGIDYDPASAAMPAGVGAVAQGAGGNNSGQSYTIDLPHSLWFTLGKEENFGSIYGYPRLSYAFRYWWSYWFRWAIADRAFERKADPSVLVRHPDGDFTDDNGTKMSYAEYALLMGERMRSGGVIALPSEVYEDANGRGTLRQWEIEFTKDATNFEPFDKSFEYLDVQKLRSLFIPEQAFLEGKGGTSSRNVAAEMGDSFIESQAVTNQQIVEHANRYLIPQWLAVNYPEFVANENGSANIVMQGFADEDVTFTTQLIQLIGQQETGAQELLKLVDIQRLLDSRGTPIADFATQQRRLKEAADAAAQSSVGAVPAIPGQSVGTAPAADGTGFSYIAPRERVELSLNGTDFIHKLPNSVHYEDNAVKGFMRRLWNVYKGLYEDEYQAVLAHIGSGQEPVTLADDDPANAAHELVATAPLSPKWPDALNLTANLLEKIMRRAGRIELKRAVLKGNALDNDGVQGYLGQRIATYAPIVAQTTRDEIRDFMASQIDEGVTDREELVRAAREHFADYPQWKADRLVRTETRDAYNAATLLAADEADVKQVQCLDGNSDNPEPDSLKRDGRIFSVADAEKQTEHPNGTLGWRLIRTNLTIERGDVDGAEFDSEHGILTLAEDLEPETERLILKSVVDSL